MLTINGDTVNQTQLKELILQALELERGGILIYETALLCVVNSELKKEWTGYLSQTREHVQVLTTLCEAMNLDPGEMTPGCDVVHRLGTSLVNAMKLALQAGDAAAAELVACEVVIMAETKDHANWGLIGACARATEGATARALQAAYDQVEDEEDEHLYHTTGWSRELHMQALGLKAILPPLEEKRDVTNARGAVRAAHASDRIRARE